MRSSIHAAVSPLVMASYPYWSRTPSGDRPHVSLSWALLQAFASSGILLSSSIRLAPTLCGDRLREGHWRLLRSQLPLLTSVGRCYPPGFLAVQTGQY